MKSSPNKCTFLSRGKEPPSSSEQTHSQYAVPKRRATGKLKRRLWVRGHANTSETSTWTRSYEWTTDCRTQEFHGGQHAYRPPRTQQPLRVCQHLRSILHFLLSLSAGTAVSVDLETSGSQRHLPAFSTKALLTKPFGNAHRAVDGNTSAGTAGKGRFRL